MFLLLPIFSSAQSADQTVHAVVSCFILPPIGMRIHVGELEVDLPRYEATKFTDEQKAIYLELQKEYRKTWDMKKVKEASQTATTIADAALPWQELANHLTWMKWSTDESALYQRMADVIGGLDQKD